MHSARIAELLAPFLGTPPANDQRLAINDALSRDISTYIDMLLRWNARINLTAIRDPEEIVTRHFGESLFAARVLFPHVYPVPSVSSLLKDFDSDLLPDVASGPGFPGIPCKLCNPTITPALIE